MQIVLRAEKRMFRLVAHDSEIMPRKPGPTHELNRSGVGQGFFHSGTVDVTLHFRPELLLTDTTQVVPYRDFVRRSIERHEILLKRDLIKQRIVTDDGVVEIKPDAHVVMPCARRQ